MTADLAARAAASSGGGGGGPFEQLFGHVVPHQQGELFGIPVWNIQLFQLIAVALVFVAFAGVARAVREERGNAMQRVMAGWVGWIRDEMVLPYLEARHARKLLPLFLSVFFFILFMNLLGLVPFGATATASVYTTAGMATITLVCMIGGGMLVQGPLAFWKNLIPHGLPAWLVPLMLAVEVVGLVVKPFALTIRLFANMTGGHLVLLSFLGLVFYFGSTISLGAGFGIAPVSIAMSVFIMIIEGFVALLQAYIFAQLSIIFVGMCLHPEH